VLASPPVVLDCAHNGAGAGALARYLAPGCPHSGPLWLVLGVLADRDFMTVAGPLLPHAAHLIVTAPDSPRSGDVATQAGQVSRRDLEVTAIPKVSDALDAAVSGARRSGGWVCVAGSIYTVGEARAHMGAAAPYS